MKTDNLIYYIFYTLIISLIAVSCTEKQEIDPCLETSWLNAEEYEIKLAVRVSENNPSLPGGTSGSMYPSEFSKMQISGTIEKIECDDSTAGPVNLGNSYLDTDIDSPAPLNETGSYWIGHVVYVYEFDNDQDHLKFEIEIKITMDDDQSYTCSISEIIHSEGINRVPGELYYYILLDIYSEDWVKE